MIHFYCVYKTGGDFSPEYVNRLAGAIHNFCSLKHKVVCLTDYKEKLNVDIVVPLKHNWEGWWSKIELFRNDLPGKIGVYFDLDTVINGNLNKIVKLAYRINFGMLRGFNPRIPNIYASGVMAGDFKKFAYVYEIFKVCPEQWIQNTIKRANQRGQKAGLQGDQGYIGYIINLDEVIFLQDLLPPNYITGKRHTKRATVIPKSSIIAWTGKPRLHNQSSPLSKIWRKYE